MSPTPGGASGPRGRIEWIDAGRGIAIAMVACFHAANWLSTAGAGVEGWIQGNLVVSSLRMPLFFTLSGLFAAKWVNGSWPALVHTKVRLYSWVFLLWGLVGTVIFVLGVRMKGQGSFEESAESYLLSPVVPRLELWFIWALALFFVAAKLTVRVWPALQLGLAAVASAIALSGWETASVGWSGAVKYYVFFLIGLHLRALVLRIGSTGRQGLLVGALALWATVSFLLWRFDLRDVLGVYFLNCLLGVVAGIAAARLLSRFAFLRSIGSQTLPIYLAHTPIIVLTAIALHLSGVLGHRAVDLLAPPALVAVAIAVALRLRDQAVRHGAGFLYDPPVWFFGGSPVPRLTVDGA